MTAAAAAAWADAAKLRVRQADDTQRRCVFRFKVAADAWTSLSVSANQDNLTYCILKYRFLLQEGGFVLLEVSVMLTKI